MNVDWIMYAIIAAFVVWEAIAHYVFRNVHAHTLSNRIEWLEREGGWPVRFAVALTVVLFGVHLEGVF